MRQPWKGVAVAAGSSIGRHVGPGHGVHDTEDVHHLLLELVRSVGLLHVTDVALVGPASLSELFALHDLDVADGLSQQQLATRLRLDKSTVSRLVAGLESRGLLVRERDQRNRRVILLSLTAAGRAMHRELAAALHAHQSRVLEAMTEVERSALATGLSGLLRALHGTSGETG